MDVAGLFPSQTSPATVPSTIAATGLARASLESNWHSAADSGKAKLNSTSKNTLAVFKRYLKHTESTSKCFLDEKLPHVGATLDTMMMAFLTYHLLVKTRIHYQDSCTIILV